MIKTPRGFTLIEILVVIGLIAILATIVLIAINPARQFAQANNTQRTSNVNAILNAIGQYMADNKGATPATFTATPTEIKTSGIDICDELVPTYLPALPVDPKTGSYSACATTYNTGYLVSVANGRIKVEAPATEKPPATADIYVIR